MLPKIDLPIYELTVPSTGEVIKVRPFTVKEEKLLMMALEEGNIDDIIKTTKQIINNCILSEGVNIDKLPFFDVDYIFIFLRAKSIGDTVEVQLTCNNVLEDGNKCGNIFPADMDIAKCDIIKDDSVLTDVKLTADKGVKLKYPNYSTIKRVEQNEVDAKTNIIVNSIDYIYDKNGQYSWKDYSKDELKEFVEGLTEENFKKLENFVDNFPTFMVRIQSKCPKCGFDHDVRYSDFYDFFF